MNRNIPQRLKVMTHTQLCERVMKYEDALTKCGDELIKARNSAINQQQRGDTYRARALALRRQAKMWRTTSEYNKEQAEHYQNTATHLRELLNGEVTP